MGLGLPETWLGQWGHFSSVERLVANQCQRQDVERIYGQTQSAKMETTGTATSLFDRTEIGLCLLHNELTPDR